GPAQIFFSKLEKEKSNWSLQELEQVFMDRWATKEEEDEAEEEEEIEKGEEESEEKETSEEEEEEDVDDETATQDRISYGWLDDQAWRK
ncbi:hypothetical protein KI387_022143, partial [Taxus chinensis]